MSNLSRAKVILLAVHLTSNLDLTALQLLLARNAIPLETILRIMLTHLPETLDPTEYVPFLEHLVHDREDVSFIAVGDVDVSSIEEISEDLAKLRVRKLGLLRLAPPNLSSDVPEDPLVLFLLHRAYRIDELTGLLVLIPRLFTPFLHRASYLRRWLITSVLPLVRLNYEYHVGENTLTSIPRFEALQSRAAVALLLSSSNHIHPQMGKSTVGRDIKGLIGPWMYGRKSVSASIDVQVSPSPKDTSTTVDLYDGWEETLSWIIQKGSDSWETAVQAIEHWDGPGDVDLGGFEDGLNKLNEDDQQRLEIRYARAILATAYSIQDASTAGLIGVGRIISRLVSLMDQERLPTLEQAAALLQPIPNHVNDLLLSEHAAYLRNNLMEENNILTKPDTSSVHLAHALLISAFLFVKMGINISLRAMGELVLLQDRTEQTAEFLKIVSRASNHQRQDERFWLRVRNEVIWLRSWGAEELQKPATPLTHGRGSFGLVDIELIEKTILEALLSNSQFSLARTIYEPSTSQPLTQEVLRQTIVSSALRAYENATNANKTRGGIKKALDILGSFPRTLLDSAQAEQLKHLIDATHIMGNYKLVFKQGEPFKPVQLLVHSDPIAILGKVLDQNPKSYSQVNDFIDIGEGMVRSGLVSSTRSFNYNVMDTLDHDQVSQDLLDAKRRIVSMCIDAALSEDDFETAYSFVVTKLKDSNTLPSSETTSGSENTISPIVDDWSWRAALQAGQYRRTVNTLKPTHLGNTIANPAIRHLEQRMECLAQALRLSPKAALQIILNIFRRCEEELESLLKQEAEEEAAWDAQGDVVMPGGFDPTPAKKNTTSNVALKSEEAPMSLFDLSKASMQRAQSGIASLAMAKNSQTRQPDVAQSRRSTEISRTSTPDSMNAPVRKRDQLRNVAVGGLASGVGWILGAQPVKPSSEDGKE